MQSIVQRKFVLAFRGAIYESRTIKWETKETERSEKIVFIFDFLADSIDDQELPPEEYCYIRFFPIRYRRGENKKRAASPTVGDLMLDFFVRLALFSLRSVASVVGLFYYYLSSI